MKQSLRDWAAGKGWNAHDKVFYGRHNGYHFTAFETLGNKVFGTALANPTVAQGKFLLSSLKSSRKALKIGQIQITQNVLVVFMKNGLRGTTGEEIDALVEGVAKCLSENGLEPGRCAICGAQGATEAVFHRGYAKQVCTGCLGTLTGESDPEAFEKAQGRNYVIGAIGAIAGGLAATIPWIIMGMALQIVSVFQGCLIAWGAIAGYKLVKGRIGPATVWILGVVSAACVFVAEMGIWAVILAREGVPVTLRVLQALLVVPAFRGTVWRGILQAYLFGLAGVVAMLARFKVDSAPVERLPA